MSKQAISRLEINGTFQNGTTPVLRIGANGNLPFRSHSIEFAYRETKFEMDRLLVTSNLSFVPTGLGTTPTP